MKQIRNIGIFAHVDAGKTTLSEQILAHSGTIRTIGSVDSGTAHTDRLAVERRRGISVKATCVTFDYNNVQINLIDTPGHVDFSSEVERSLWALDAAILVVCAVEGVQPQTEVLFNAMVKQKLPVIFFINKTDRENADTEKVVNQIHRLLTDKAVLLNDNDAITELICDTSDDLLEQYLNGQAISPAVIKENFVRLVEQQTAYPILCGSALRNDGIIELLDAVVEYLPAPKSNNNLCAIVFAAQHDKVLGKGVWIRMYGGCLENRDAITLNKGIDPISGDQIKIQNKITQIFDASSNAVGRLFCGEIGLVYGLSDIDIGHVLGDGTLTERTTQNGQLRTPLITVQVIPSSPDKMPVLRAACDILSGEDPLLQAQYIQAFNELHLRVMGTIQLEIIEELLDTRFDLKVTFGEPAIIYKETVSTNCEGFVAYTMPKPCWAVLKFEISPAERGSGVTFSSEVPVRKIMARYQHQVEQALPLALNQGRLGWQVTDVNIKLIDGEHHLVHTHPLDFIVATPMAIQDGLVRGGSTLLEPILMTRFILPSDCVGRVMSDVAIMRGEVLDSFQDGERVILNALIPVQTSLNYSITLASFTSGRGAMSVKLHGYKECPLELGATAKRRNVDPLDKGKYILAARSALNGGIFNLD